MLYRPQHDRMVSPSGHCAADVDVGVRRLTLPELVHRQRMEPLQHVDLAASPYAQSIDSHRLGRPSDHAQRGLRDQRISRRPRVAPAAAAAAPCAHRRSTVRRPIPLCRDGCGRLTRAPSPRARADPAIRDRRGGDIWDPSTQGRDGGCPPSVPKADCSMVHGLPSWRLKIINPRKENDAFLRERTGAMGVDGFDSSSRCRQPEMPPLIVFLGNSRCEEPDDPPPPFSFSFFLPDRLDGE